MTRKQSTAVRFSRTDKMPLRSKHSLLETFAGRGSGEGLYNAEGCKLEVEAVMVSHPPDRFNLCINVGGDWFEVLSVQPDDPAVDMLRKAKRMTTYGPSAREIERQKQKEREEQIAREWEANKASNRAAEKSQIRNRQAKRQAVLDAKL